MEKYYEIQDANMIKNMKKSNLQFYATSTILNHQVYT